MMHQSKVHLLDLPDEILLIILKNLNNIDVLYSLMNIVNPRLRLLAQEENFSNTLDFRSIDDTTSSTDQRKLDRFCNEILPGIQYNVRCFILEPISMERILLAANYPHLTDLQLFDFKQQIALDHFTDESPLRSIFQQQITSLTLGISDKSSMNLPGKNYTINVYEHLLKFFQNLRYLNVIESFNPLYPRLTLCDLPYTTFFSSTLTYLCINLHTFDDCLCLLNGRLKQLSSLLVQVIDMKKSSSIVHNMDVLSNLKCFSFKHYFQTDTYDRKIVPLLRRMSYLEQLTLYFRIKNRVGFIGRPNLENEVLVYMPQIHSFNFYISTHGDAADLFRYVPSQEIRQTITSIGHQRVISMINCDSLRTAVHHTFSLLFLFDRLEDVGNTIPDTVFRYVTHLLIQDVIPFEHEFFLQVARCCFPLLTHFRVVSVERQSLCNINTNSSGNSQLYSIAQYPHLTSLDVFMGNADYVDEFLNERKTSVPCLTELTAVFNNLRIVTQNFTREETRRNCAKVKRLILTGAQVHPKEFYIYFPLL